MENRVEKYFPDDGKKPAKRPEPDARGSGVDVAAYPIDSKGLVVLVVHTGSEQFQVYMNADTAEKAWSRLHDAWAELTGFYKDQDGEDDDDE